MAPIVRIRRRIGALCCASTATLAPLAGAEEPAAMAGDQTAAAAGGAAQTVVVEGRSRPASPGIGGFGDLPLAATPLSVQPIDAERIRDLGLRTLADVPRLDAAVSDAYNAEGYWSNLTIRGYPLDIRFNYRRDGLPINAETVLPLDNFASIEVLKGASGMQAGTSAPGGLVNFVVKRPEGNARSIGLAWRERGTVGAALDLSQRFGEGEAFGVRLNAGIERLDPQTQGLRGHANLLALAGDWRAGPGTLIEAEIESARHVQPSVPGFSLLGDAVPDARRIDPRTNLNNQPWSLPVAFGATTGSLRLTQQLGDDWQLVAHAMRQRLTTDDRIAFPFGCSAENRYDRYCSDGTFDLYDFRSEGERRRSDAIDVHLAGRLALGPATHHVTAGVLYSRFESRFQRQAFNYAGTGNIEGTLVTPPNAELTDENTHRTERSTEFYLRDAIAWGRWGAWLGARVSRIERESVRTDGSRPIDYGQSFTTPWLSLSYAPAAQQLVYLSWGQGVESFVTPNRTGYARPGAPLPSQKSRQLELGTKGRANGLQWSAAAFDIDRPLVTDTGLDYFVDGSQRHRGIEGQVEGRAGGWQWLAGAMALRARIEGAGDASRNGLRPPNVPARSARLMIGRDIGALPGLHLQAWLAYEGDRTLLPEPDSPTIGGWTRIDLAARVDQRLPGGTRLTWRLGLDNATDRRAWKEAPYQFGHVYLYPLAPRTWRGSVQAEF